MVWFVSRAPSSSAATVVCYRCGGNHFAKNKRFPERNCKAEPVLALRPSGAIAIVQSVLSGFARRLQHKLAQEKPQDSVTHAQQDSKRAPAVQPQESKLVVSLRVELAAKCVELKAKDQEIALLREKLSAVSASLDSVKAKLDAHGKQLTELEKKGKRAVNDVRSSTNAEVQVSGGTSDQAAKVEIEDSVEPFLDIVDEKSHDLLDQLDGCGIDSDGSIVFDCVKCKRGVVYSRRCQRHWVQLGAAAIPLECPSCYRSVRKQRFPRPFDCDESRPNVVKERCECACP